MSLSASGQQSAPALFAEGIISTADYETHPAFSPSGDTVYFLQCKADLSICTICVSYKEKNTWTKPLALPFSGQYQDVDPFVTRDGHTLYFASNRPVSKGDSLRPDWDIWKVAITKNGWGEPVHLEAPINSDKDEYYPTLTDGDVLYFGSGREGGKGGADIYRSVLSNGKFSEPENLGDAINTADNEYEPFIAPDESYMIFMATIPKGLKNADLYISYNHQGKWSKPKKLRDGINSASTDWSPKVTRDGKYFFFGSTRRNGLGDIYYIKIDRWPLVP